MFNANVAIAYSFGTDGSCRLFVTLDKAFKEKGTRLKSQPCSFSTTIHLLHLHYLKGPAHYFFIVAEPQKISSFWQLRHIEANDGYPATFEAVKAQLLHQPATPIVHTNVSCCSFWHRHAYRPLPAQGIGIDGQL
jgi:hypothetical protein